MNKHIRTLLEMIHLNKQNSQVPEKQPIFKISEEQHSYWRSQSQPWRTSSEIDAKHQNELRNRQAIVPDIVQGIYPFRGMKLTRAEVEWLLATHESGEMRGPVNWSDEKQRNRVGLDLRGADLRNSDLSNLPLSCILGGLTWLDSLDAYPVSLEEQRNMAALHLEGSDLRGSHLEGASLRGAHLEGTHLGEAHLEGADLSGAYLEGANLGGAYLRNTNFSQAYLEGANLVGAHHLEEANFSQAHLDRVNLRGVHLENTVLFVEARLREANLTETHFEGADLSEVHLEEANLSKAHLEGAKLVGAFLERANLYEAHLEGARLWSTYMKQARLSEAHLEGADLRLAHLQQAILSGAHLEGANLSETHLEGAFLGWTRILEEDQERDIVSGAHLEGKRMSDTDLERIRKWVKNFPDLLAPANLRDAFFDSATSLERAHLGNAEYGFVSLADVHWGDVNLHTVDWKSMKMLGDENEARRSKTREGQQKDKATRLKEYQVAVRANRQLAVVLQNQGLNEEATRFAYHAQILQRKVLWKQHDYGRWLFSILLALLAGYGYRIWRILAAYIIVVSACALAYFVLGMYYTPHLTLLDAVLTSITAFHGRVFSEPFLHPGLPQLWVTAFEAVMGLVIEGVFIAMLTQRFFGK